MNPWPFKKLGYLLLLLLNYKSSLFYIQALYRRHIYQVWRIFLLFCGLSFLFLGSVLCSAKLLILMKSFFFYFAFGVIYEKHCLVKDYEDLHLCFLLRILYCHHLTFKSLIQLELFFCIWCQTGSKFLFLHVDAQFPSSIFWKDYPSLNELSWNPYQKWVDHKCMGSSLHNQLFSFVLYPMAVPYYWSLIIVAL